MGTLLICFNTLVPVLNNDPFWKGIIVFNILRFQIPTSRPSGTQEKVCVERMVVNYDDGRKHVDQVNLAAFCEALYF